MQVVLHEAENAWKPKKFEENGEESDMAILERKARAILNKLTPQKFDKLVLQFKELDIDSAEKLEMGMELVFEKVMIVLIFIILGLPQRMIVNF